jgi:RNA polymerase primary sigma factor
MRQLKISQSVTNRSTKAVDNYLSDISKIGMISQDREIELAIRIRGGDEKALVELVHSNLRFVVSVSKQYQNRGVDLLDLINDGNLGLIKAAQRFDETKGFKFISYAVWWIRQSVLESIANNGRLIRVPLNKLGLQKKFLTSHSKLEQKLGRLPNDEEVMEDMGLSNAEIRDLMATMNRVQSYDAPMSENENSGSLLDVTLGLDSDTNSPDEPLVTLESIKIDLERVMVTLTPRERDVLKMYFGIGHSQILTLDEIADKFELTRERVRQIKEKSIRKLRVHSRAELMRKYLN